MSQKSVENTFMQQLNHALYHTMKEPLRNLSCLSGLLNEQIKSTKNRELQTYTSSLTDNATRLSGIINGLSGLLALSTQQLSIEETALEDLMLTVLEHLGRTYPQPEVQVNLSPLPTVSIDPVLMSQAFFEVLKNAQESGLGGPVKIDISAQETPTGYEILIKDNGAGISQPELKKVTTLFYSSERSKEHLGIGLTKASHIISLHGGAVFLSSHGENGTTVKIKLNK